MYTTQYNTADEDDWTPRSVSIDSEAYIDIMSEPVDLQQRRCLMLDLSSRFLDGMEAEVSFLLCSKARRNKDLSMAFNLPEPEIARLKASIVRKASIYVKYFYNINIPDVYTLKLTEDYTDEWTDTLNASDSYNLLDIPEVKSMMIHSILAFERPLDTAGLAHKLLRGEVDVDIDTQILISGCKEADWADGEPTPKNFEWGAHWLAQFKKLTAFMKKAATDGDDTYEPLRDYFKEVRFCTSDCRPRTTLEDLL